MPDEARENPPGAAFSPAPPEPEPQRKSNANWWLGVGLGCGTLLVLLLGLGVVLGLSAFSKVRPRGRPGQCKANLRQIGLACHIYADDNDEEFPPDLAHLYPALVDNAKVFSCPSRPSSYKDFTLGPAAVGERSSSYVYLPGRWPALPGDFFLAYEKIENHGGAGFNVLYVDAHVEWWPKDLIPDVRAKLAEQEARLPELRKKRDAEKKAGTAKTTGTAEEAP